MNVVLRFDTRELVCAGAIMACTKGITLCGTLQCVLVTRWILGCGTGSARCCSEL